jgi:hypothetical protein
LLGDAEAPLSNFRKLRGDDALADDKDFTGDGGDVPGSSLLLD